MGAVLLCIAAATHGLIDERWHAAWTVSVIVFGAWAVGHGVRRNDPPREAGWHRFAIGIAVYAAGDVAYVILGALLGREHPVVIMPWYLALLGIPVAVSGLRRVLRVGDPVADAEGRIDAGIIATVIGFIGWHALVAPQIARGGWASYGVLGSTIFWVTAVVLMGFIINRALHDGGMSPSLALLAATVPLTAATSLVYFVRESQHVWESAPIARPLMALSYAAGAAATWHPSMVRAARQRRRDETNRTRFLIVAGGILLVPTWHLLAVVGAVPPLAPDLPGTIVLILLAVMCLARLNLTLRAREDDAAALERQAGEDPLTGLPNRSRLMARLEAAVVEAASEDGSGVGLVMLDLDRFKVVNDSLGHPAGDQLLIEVARRLLAAVDGAHMVARLGGDEFVVLCEPDVEESAMVDLAHRVREHLAVPLRIQGHEFGTTASLGIAVLGQETPTAEDLLRDADVALYHAKDAGRDGVALFDAAVRAKITARMHTERELRQALQEDGLDLAYQPLVDTGRGEVVGVEALLRWKDPSAHDATPQEVVQVAEEVGLIEPLGAWVLRRATRDVAAWVTAHPGSELLLGINVSGLQLRRPGFAGFVLRTLADAGLPPSHLVIELTESVMIDDWSRPRQTLDVLRAAGVRVSMDDFGTGYSALATLRRFPFNSVKIDRAFVAGLGAGEGDVAIVRAMIGMAHGLGMRVVGEGVEHRHQADLLAALGCDLIQGYHVARPMPWAAVTAILPGAPVAKVAVLD